MHETTFTAKVKKYFRCLECEYRFRITTEDNSEVRPKTDGVVIYTSDTTVVVVDSETGDATVWFYRIKDGIKYRLDPVAIDEYLSTNEAEKGLLLSRNPKDQASASALFKQKFLLNQPSWILNEGSTEDKLEFCLKNYSNWLKAHAHLCLTGDFSQWPDFFEYKTLRARSEHLRRGKDELGYVLTKDQAGNRKLIKQSIFKEKLEHIEKLRKEFPSQN